MYKGIVFSVAAFLTAAILVGCTSLREELIPDGREITITGIFADSPTKTTLNDGGTASYWEVGDEIKVFYGSGSSRFTSTLTQEAAVSSFTGSLNCVIGSSEGESASNSLWAVYPYRDDAVFDGSGLTTTLPCEQTGRAGSFAKDMCITIAESDSFNMRFYNVCGGVRFSLTKSGVKSVTFKAVNGESIAGRIKVAFDGNVPAVEEITEPSGSILLKAPGGGAFETGKWYYIVALPCTLEDGFVMIFNTDSQYAVLKSSESVTIRRSVFGSITDADAGLVFKNRDAAPAGSVDLGMSVYWGTCNIGAANPEDYGNYYAWGETQTKSVYNWTTYKWCNTSKSDPNKALTKYCPAVKGKYYWDGYVEGSNEADDKTVLDAEDDVAHVVKGGNWRTPTEEEWAELVDFCTWTSTERNGVEGKEGKSVINGNTIFLPYAGYKDDGTYGAGLTEAGSCGDYFSATVCYYGSAGADLNCSRYFNEYGTGQYFAERSCGLPFRPVSE